MGLGFAISSLTSINSNLTFSLTVLIFFITALITSLISNGFIYKNISTLENLTSQIAKGSTKKKFIKALKDDSSEFRNVATSISEISESLKKNINLIGRQRDQFGSVLDDLGEGVVVTDINGNITFENEKFSQILNLENNHSENLKDIGIKSLEYLHRRSKKKKRADIEFEIELGDKSTRWVLATINKSKNTSENILVVHDITPVSYTHLRAHETQ